LGDVEKRLLFSRGKRERNKRDYGELYEDIVEELRGGLMCERRGCLYVARHTYKKIINTNFELNHI
jgi:hypothetical protein